MLNRLFLIAITVLLSCTAGWTAPGDIISVTIDPTGWRAEIVIEGFSPAGTYNFGLDNAHGNNPATAKCIFRVKRPGYSSAALPDTVTDVVYGTVALRKPFPNQAMKDEDANSGNVRVRVVLSEYIHDRDSVRCDLTAGWYTNTAGTGAPVNAFLDKPCVNASKQDYALPVGNWTYPDHQLITNDAISAQCFVVHRSGRNGRPVACVVFTASDESGHTVKDTVLVPSVNARMTDAVPVCEYWTRMNVSSLHDGDKITLNFKAYPWVGDAALSSDDSTITGLNSNFRDQVFYIDRSNSYGRAYAVVDTAGNNGTGAVSTNSAAAFAAPFAELGTALHACETYCSAHFSRTNADNCVIYLTAGTHKCVGSFIGLSNTKSRVWTEIRGDPAHNQDQIILIPDPSDMLVRKIGSQYTRLSHVTLLQNADTWIALAPSPRHVLWLDQVKLAGYEPAKAWYWAIHDYACVYITHSLIDSSIRSDAAIIRGNTITNMLSLSKATTIVGNQMSARVDANNDVMRGADENAVVAYNLCYRIRNVWLSHGATNTTCGVAVVGNLIERVGNGGQPIMNIGAYGTAIRNAIVWNNSFVGNRYLAGYCEVSNTEQYVLCSHKNSTYNYLANKVDVFSQDGTHVGGWPITFGVGCSGNMIMHRPFNQEFTGIHCILSTNTGNIFGYKNDQSDAGAGFGDYSMDGTGEGVGLTRELTMPLDITGRPYVIPGASGAYEYTPPPKATGRTP